MPSCLIGLGSNLGDRSQTLDQAVERLRCESRVRVTARSGWHETAPIGGPAGQASFLNGAVVLETSIGPEALLALLDRIEAALGRRRTERWGPRTVDLDLLLYGERVLETGVLTVPHPRMAWRRFVLEPASEVAGSMLHPTTGWTIARLFEHLNTAVSYVAIAGPIGVGKTSLARQLAQTVSATGIFEEVTARRLETFYADPSGHAWSMELEFLRERARLLSAHLLEWSEPGRLWVSDFWFDQCLAFAQVWLSPERLDAFRRRWEEARRTVVRPKLTVLLDAPGDQLFERIRRRGRRCERRLTLPLLERIRQEILTQASRTGQGPLMHLAGDDLPQNLEEVSAAIEAMK